MFISVLDKGIMGFENQQCHIFEYSIDNFHSENYLQTFSADFTLSKCHEQYLPKSHNFKTSFLLIRRFSGFISIKQHSIINQSKNEKTTRERSKSYNF